MESFAQTDSQDYVRDIRSRLQPPPAAVAEIYAGAYPREHKDIEAFFNLCQLVATDADIARMAGGYVNRYRKAFQGISIEGYLLAATA